MLVASIPATKIPVIWASGASGTYVRTPPVTTGDPNAASFTLGFPPNTAVAIGAGGVPPDIRDFNGFPQVLSAWVQWQNAGGPIFYDATFSAAVGGYPKWAMLANAATPGLFWISSVDNNTSNPDTGGANWLQFPPTSSTPVTSFNTRTGAVTLSSSDVVAALSANALANAKLALMPAATFKANLSGSPATPSDWVPSAVATVLQPVLDLAQILSSAQSMATPGYIQIGSFILQWGQTPAISENTGVYTAALPIAFPAGALSFGCSTVNGAGSTLLDAWAQVVACSTTQIQVIMQAVSGAASASAPVNWYAIGH